MNIRYKANQLVERLVQAYIAEWNNLRTSTDLGYLAKSCGFYAIPWILSYYEIFGHRTIATQIIAILVIVQLPFVICASIRLYWGMIYTFAKFRSNQKTISDYT